MLAQTQEVAHSRPLKGFPARKRRKLAVATASTAEIPPAPKPRRSSTVAMPAVPGQCISCHRLYPPGGTVACAICSSSTCLICARQCTAAPAPVSTPPTPRLSNSPTPPATPVRSTLALAPTNFATGAQVRERERRKRCEEEEEDVEWEWEAGCSRTLCRGCCLENDVTHGNTCLDCCGLSPHPSLRLTAPSSQDHPTRG